MESILLFMVGVFGTIVSIGTAVLVVALMFKKFLKY